MLNLHDEIELQIEKMANEGKGLGRYDNQVIFVPLSAPGDVLKVKITKKSKNFCEAEILEIKSPSKDRIQAPCPYYGECGGCNFQHIRYPQQLEIKNSLVLETLKKFLKKEALPSLPPQASPEELHYRNRIQLHKEGSQIGFYKRKSHQLLPISACLIAEKPINEYLPQITKDKNISSEDKVEVFLDAQLKTQHRIVSQESAAYLFSQVNRFQNENLVKSVLEIASSFKTSKIYDLYAGSGNFTFPLAQKLKGVQIEAVELSEELVNQGKQIAQQQPSKNQSPIHFVQSSVEYYLRNVRLQSEDLVILDPPRTGCHSEVMTILGSQKRHKIIYISCNYMTLARDLAVLSETAKNWGHQLEVQQIQCFDMFPQTDHIEVLSVLSIS